MPSRTQPMLRRKTKSLLNLGCKKIDSSASLNALIYYKPILKRDIHCKISKDLIFLCCV
jgi:hypothetical protein